MNVHKKFKNSRLLFAFIATTITFGLVSAGYSIKKKTSGKLETYVPIPPRSNGAAAMGLGDRTGSPIGGANSSCANCHSGGAFAPTISIDVKDASMNSITSYVPGTTYTIEYTVAAGSGSPSGYGFQGVALNASNGAAGSLVSALTSNTQIVTIGGVDYLEHQGASSSGVFQSSWTAPAAGSGAVSIYGRGLATNGNGGTSGDATSASVVFGLIEIVPTTISYPGTPYCANDSDPTPVQTGEQGGTFSAPAGVAINASTGVIDISNSSEGTYQIDYTYSQGTTSFGVTIYPTYSETEAATICSNETYTFGTQVLNASNAGLNTAILQSQNCCDSTVVLDLSVLTAPNETTTATICSNETYTFGTQVLDASNAGLNTEIFQAANGCDSTVILDLIVETIDDQITFNQMTLTATQTGATYQWLDCLNGFQPIAGETNQSFTPSNNGSYAIEITVNGCSDTSSCFLIEIIGVDELNTSTKELIKIVDLMGRETTFKPNTPLLYIYSDGTRVRVMQIEE